MRLTQKYEATFFSVSEPRSNDKFNKRDQALIYLR